jgi:putative ATP-dependent endonuclease of OLD family
MFDTSNNPNTAIYKQVSCLTDLDPIKGDNNISWPPIFQEKPDGINKNIDNIKSLNSSNIAVFSQNEDSGYEPNEGWTFEYQLFMDNTDPRKFIFLDSTIMKYCSAWKKTNDIDIKNTNISRISNIFDNIVSKKIDTKLKSNLGVDDLSRITDPKLIKQYLGTMFLNSIKDKGLYAQELSEKISDGSSIIVPKYIRKCFKWMVDKHEL